MEDVMVGDDKNPIDLAAPDATPNYRWFCGLMEANGVEAELK